MGFNRQAPCAAERDGSLSGWSTGEGEGGLDARGRVCTSPDNGSGSGGERGGAKGEEGQGEWVSQLGRQKGRQAKAPRGGRQYPFPIRRPGPIRPLGARGGRGWRTVAASVVAFHGNPARMVPPARPRSAGLTLSSYLVRVCAFFFFGLGPLPRRGQRRHGGEAREGRQDRRRRRGRGPGRRQGLGLAEW